jgi:hypothetical protein
VKLAGEISVIFFCKFFIRTEFENLVGIYRKQKILTETEFFVGRIKLRYSPTDPANWGLNGH